MAREARHDPTEPWLNGFSYDQAFNGRGWDIVERVDADLSAWTIAERMQREYDRRYGKLIVKVKGDTVYVRRVLPSEPSA
jgi:hypothetical protein